MFRCNVKRPSLHALLVVLLCLCTSLQTTALSTPLQGKEISISVKKSSLSNVLYEISKKSGITIYFVNEDLVMYKDITYEAKNQEVKNILNDLLKGKDLQYEVISEKQIGIRKVKVRAVNDEELRDTLVTVSGTVTNEKGEPLPGATVKVKNKKIGATADANGNFVIKNISSTAVLTISNVSHATLDIPISGRSSIGRISLKELIGSIDEAIVIAYGTTTRKLNPGSVGSIKSKEIEQQPVNNPLYALQGRIPGLIVTPTTGLAGGVVNVQIRGKNSYGYSSNPLIVIDGLPIVNTVNGLGYSNLSQLSSLAFINPNDIESIDVLKDADATSIYGSRGANGVILLTTKKGAAGKTEIEINAQTGWASVPQKIKLLNTEQYLSLRKEGYSNSGFDLSTATLTQSRADVMMWDQKRYTDWQSELIGKTASYNHFQGRILGGNNTLRYLVGANFHKETTVFPGGNADQKGGVHFNLNGASDNNRFRAILSGSYIADKNTLPDIDFTGRALTLQPNAPQPYNADGSLNWELLPSGTKSWDNPFAALYRTYTANIYNLTSSADLSYKLLDYLTIKTQLGFNQLRGKAFRRTGPFEGRSPEDMLAPASSGFNTNEVTNLSVEPQLSYNQQFGNAKISGLIGASYQSTSMEEQSIIALGFTDDALLQNLGAATSNFINNSSSEYKYTAIFGRVTFNWNDKYIFNVNARRDGSTRFGPGNQFGNFGSIGGAWIFSQESFFEPILPIVSFGKIRASYGTSGNDGIGDYQYLEKYEPITNADLYQGVRGYRTSGIFNSYYRWEVTKKLEVGFEAGFFNDKLQLTSSYFRNRSDNQLLTYPYPTMVGPGGAVTNLPALIQNNGIEISLNSENIKTKKFRWTTIFTYTRNRNKLLAFPSIGENAFYSSLIGQPFSGVSQVYGSAGVDPSTGVYQFYDEKGTITSSPENPSNIDNGRYVRIMTDPKFYGGLSNTFVYGRFSVDIFLQFVKQNGVNPIINYLPTAGGPTNLPAEFNDRWQKIGDQKQIQRIYYYPLMPEEFRLANNYQQVSDYGYVDASFIRLKNFSLEYNLTSIRKKAGIIRNARIYLQSQNLFTITKYKGLDPETQSISALPPLRVITIGTKISL